jgi:hypothetical protein
MSIKTIVVNTSVSNSFWVICLLQKELTFFAFIQLLNCHLASQKEELHSSSKSFGTVRNVLIFRVFLNVWC